MLETSLKSVAHAYGMTLDISFEQAIKDTPQFRSSMYVFADELDELEKWLDNIAKTCRLYTDSMSKINDIGLAISRRMVVNKCISLLDGTANMRTVSESMITLHGLRQKMEARRNYEKDIEKIEMSISRYVALPKSKETSALVEDSFVLFEARKQFIKTSINYVSKIIILKYTLDSQIPDILKTCVKVHADYLEAGWDAFNGIDVVLKTLGPKLDNLRETRDETMKRLDIIRREYEERAIENARPKLKYTLENEKQVFQKSTLKTSNPAQIEREGYLFRKSSKGGSVWTRRYFTIKNTTISYCTVATTGTHKGKLMATSACSLESCDVRVAKTEDRRFCFEVQILPKTLFVLQAEHEEDMKAWITTIENSKMFPSNCSGIPATLESNNSESLRRAVTMKSRIFRNIHDEKTMSYIIISNPFLPEKISWKFNFKTYGKCDRVYSSIMLVWNNVRSATPLSAQDLYNQIQLLTRGQFDRDKDAQLQHQKTLDKKSFLDSTEADTQADDKRMVSDASVKKMSTFEYTLPESVQAPTGEISYRKESIWTSGPTPNREVSYILAMNNPMVKLREVDVKETDHILKQNEWISGLKGLAETCADLLVILREVTGQDNETSKENMENLDEAGNVSKALGDRSTDGFKTSDTARWRSTPARDDGKFILKGVTLYTIIGITILSLLINARMWFILLPGLSGPQISDARSQFQSTERQFIPADQGKDSYLRATSQIDWATELQSASLKSISPRMREFLRLQFGVNKDTEMDKFPISLQPAKNNLLMRTLESMQFGRMHTKLVHWQRMISDTRTELVSLEKVLDGMEIHLVWSMYFNWVQDDLKSKCKGLENGQNHTSGHLCSFVVDELEIP
ncbi:hypothetical protein BSLG_009798 [Batrachochytrium salamandrivorans]|nr:hypothetical protein BSLG_009798 [Batrachochytrium salamandrivorans]